MISAATIIACVMTLLISLVLPAAALVVFAARNRKQGIVSAWFLGAAGFFVTQILIRLPVLLVLQSQNWFVRFSQEHLFAYAFGLAFTAGLFELAGRFGVAKLMEKKLTWNRALAAGLGHGGIEAMVLIGMTYISNLVLIVMINTGAFETLLTQTAASGMDVSALELIREQLLNTAPALFLLGGFERILAMTCHTAMSVLVCWGVRSKKLRPCLLACLGIHTFIDLTAGISLVLPQITAYIVIYSILIAVAAVSLLVLHRIHGQWKKEVSYDSEE